SAFNQDLSSWDVSNITTMLHLFTGVALSTANYDATLTGWNAQTLQPNVTLTATGLNYCASEADRQNMIDSDGWTIKGDALYCPPTTPGGVSAGLAFWLKADAGVTNSGDGTDATAWADQSDNGYDFTDSGASPYIYRSEGMNFNPTIDNPDQSNRVMENTNSIDVRTITVVTLPDPSIKNAHVFSEIGASDERILIGNTQKWNMPGNSSSFSTGNKGWYNGRSVNDTTYTFGDVPSIFTPEAGSLATIANGAEIGDSGGQGHWHGHIAEFVAYDVTNTDADRNKVESYLALKYGITLDQSTAQDYLASDGATTMWDSTAGDAATYNNDIFGVGRDDESALGQVKSKSSNADSIITLEADSEGTNAVNNFVEMDDLEFLTIGNNDGAAAWTATNAPAGYNILEKQWSVQETG
ncbi:MAG: BspA family leucine-rich repeat surface protein, partial [Gammaproteobacteria bacterium]|nr:BspA family leucine-rich repeat surface protein [Gammaproteobacteria bacterium]